MRRELPLGSFFLPLKPLCQSVHLQISGILKKKKNRTHHLRGWRMPGQNSGLVQLTERLLLGLMFGWQTKAGSVLLNTFQGLRVGGCNLILERTHKVYDTKQIFAGGQPATFLPYCGSKAFLQEAGEQRPFGAGRQIPRH